MKIKFIKKILIGDTVFKIIYDKTYEGAEFHYATEKEKAYIKFGMKDYKNNQLGFIGMLIHELKEIIQTEQGSRIYNSSNNNFEFHYNHKEHQDLCSRLAGLLDQFIK